MYVLMSCSFDNITSGIDIGIAVADSMGYRAPTWYRSNPSQLSLPPCVGWENEYQLLD